MKTNEDAKAGVWSRSERDYTRGSIPRAFIKLSMLTKFDGMAIILHGQIESRVICYLPTQLCNWPGHGRPDDLSRSSGPFSPGPICPARVDCPRQRFTSDTTVETSAETYGGGDPKWCSLAFAKNLVLRVRTELSKQLITRRVQHIM